MIASIYSDSPHSYDEAISCKNKNHWINAIKDELNNLYSNKIMTFVSKVPPGKNIISTKWVFATKRDSNNFIYNLKLVWLPEASVKNGVLIMILRIPQL